MGMEREASFYTEPKGGLVSSTGRPSTEYNPGELEQQQDLVGGIAPLQSHRSRLAELPMVLHMAQAA